ncbi:MAG: hypothetical protein GWN11_05110 [Candidatus Dadabacteria bacterium]|nr:hypothetical protein [Candidatus Dadabacteria bacterium]NIX15255.1 hypothetical protein [Candidatus Dadabacteria bacterium]
MTPLDFIVDNIKYVTICIVLGLCALAFLASDNNKKRNENSKCAICNRDFDGLDLYNSEDGIICSDCKNKTQNQIEKAKYFFIFLLICSLIFFILGTYSDYERGFIKDWTDLYDIMKIILIMIIPFFALFSFFRNKNYKPYNKDDS